MVAAHLRCGLAHHDLRVGHLGDEPVEQLAANMLADMLVARLGVIEPS